MTVALYRAVGAVLAKRGFEAALVGDEGGYGPRLRDNEQAMDIVVDGIRLAGFEPGRDVAIALDVASSHFFDGTSGTYRLGTGRRERSTRRAWSICSPGGSIGFRLSRSRTAWPKTTGKDGRCSPSAWGDPSSLSGTTCLPPRLRGCVWESTGCRQRDPDQVEPGGHAFRDV